METERKKFFKKKIKAAAVTGSSKQIDKVAKENYCYSDKVQNKPKNSGDLEVTVLGSSSYLNQNQDLSILKLPADIENKHEQVCHKELYEGNSQNQVSCS